jgi:hypothetical protein
MLFHLDAPQRPSPVVPALDRVAEGVEAVGEGSFEGSQIDRVGARAAVVLLDVEEGGAKKRVGEEGVHQVASQR